MKRYILVFLLFIYFFFNALNAQAAKRVVADTIQANVQVVKSILYSKEWKPVDADSYRKILELIQYIENAPVDTVLVELKRKTDSLEYFWLREIDDIPNKDKISGYVDSLEVIKGLAGIEKQVDHDLPLHSIIVPEEEFLGIYSKLPLITSGNKEQLITESIISYPDSIQTVIDEAAHTRNQRKVKHADSLVTDFLNQARKQYNDSLIIAFRDSVTQQYRLDRQNNYADSLKQSYLDAVNRKNEQVLTQYNDSVTQAMNHDFRGRLNSLITYVHRMPNELTIYNLYDEVTTMQLQNDGVWFEWVYLKNAQNDSIGVRVENLDKHTLRLLIDETVNLSRLTRRETLEVNKLSSSQVFESSLRKVHTRKPKLSPWSLGGRAYTGFTQTFINQFWSKGGTSSASTLSTYNYFANYSKKKIKWENGVDAKLGFIYYMEENENAIRRWHKSSDNVEFNSRFGLSAINKWYYSAEANFKTQFFLGYKNNREENPNSGFFAPAYLTFSGGFDYKPNKNFSAFLSPLSVKTTFVTHSRVDETKFGLEEGETRNSRIGMTGRINFTKEIMENVTVATKNSLFFNFGFADDEWQFVKLPDFDTETAINFKVNQYITTQINFHFIYDKSIKSEWTDDDGIKQSGTRLQLKEFVTLGASYKF